MKCTWTLRTSYQNIWRSIDSIPTFSDSRWIRRLCINYYDDFVTTYAVAWTLLSNLVKLLALIVTDMSSNSPYLDSTISERTCSTTAGGQRDSSNSTPRSKNISRTLTRINDRQIITVYRKIMIIYHYNCRIVGTISISTTICCHKYTVKLQIENGITS